ncbi:hypothetical protein ACX9MO_12325 [Pseudooceanicola sp. 502str34]
MKLKILGTSNGIIAGGYADALKGIDGVDVVQNLSIGSSHPTVIPFALLEDDPKADCDAFVLDMCVNEQRADAKGLFNVGISEPMLTHFRDHCARSGAAPVVLLLPNLNPEGELNRGSVDRWREICAKMGVDYIDVAALAANHGPAKDLWRDGNHPTVEFSALIAEEIISACRALDAVPSPSSTASPIHVINCDVGEKIERSTSLTTKAFSRLMEDETVQIALGDGSDFEVLGVSLNMAQTHAALEFRGSNKIVQRFDNGFFDVKRPLWFVSWGLVSPVRSANGSVSVRVIRPRNSKSQLKNDHIKGSLPVTDDLRVVMEIGGFVVRRLQPQNTKGPAG